MGELKLSSQCHSHWLTSESLKQCPSKVNSQTYFKAQYTIPKKSILWPYKQVDAKWRLKVMQIFLHFFQSAFRDDLETGIFMNYDEMVALNRFYCMFHSTRKLTLLQPGHVAHGWWRLAAGRGWGRGRHQCCRRGWNSWNQQSATIISFDLIPHATSLRTYINSLFEQTVIQC